MKVNSKYWRSVVSGWYYKPPIIKQDQDLLDFINKHNFKNIIGFGDIDYFKDIVSLGDDSTIESDFCIYIVNETFNFDYIVNDVNNIIKNKLVDGAVLYLAVNKFLAEPKNYNIVSCGNYDLDIKNYFTANINAHLLQFNIDDNDQGHTFNWAHPVTNFYFKK